MTIAWFFFSLFSFVPNVIVVLPSKQINLHSWLTGRGIPLHQTWNSVRVCRRAHIRVCTAQLLKKWPICLLMILVKKEAIFNLLLISLSSCCASSDSSCSWSKDPCPHFQSFCGHQSVSHAAGTLPRAQTVCSKEAVGRGGRTQGHCQKQKSPVAYGLSTGGQDQ